MRSSNANLKGGSAGGCIAAGLQAEWVVRYFVAAVEDLTRVGVQATKQNSCDQLASDCFHES